jgi:hypothetical protein
MRLIQSFVINIGAILDQFGYHNMLDGMMKRLVQPLSALLYPHLHSLPSTTAITASVTTSSPTDSKSSAAVSSVASSITSSSSSSASPTLVNPLDSHHGFIVEYEIGKDSKLDFHVDDADVTLNLCLGQEFKGGALYFAGAR